ncbi:diaminopropionate ammonia-lyase [Fusarium phyllophilum]|uniref:Diaminopropionate ammonia-lyase n=1 Tax=Fusarium phyllophilum TaxID=47803 RepID=A0A8H5NCE4_9HYPO|nr:diaminopropionate ammonia-lyase [Fusarium phyllophilum]
MTTRRHVHFNSKAKLWTSPEPASAEAIDRFHQSLPNYEPTPLVSLDSLAKEIGVGAVHIKDETNRFGLPAFKILGASWGAFRSITEKFGLPLDSDTDTVREAAKSHQLTLYAATEGNHGRAVAFMGAVFDISAEIHVPASMHPSTVKLIESEGAKVVMSKGRYEDAMLEAESASKHEKGIMVQDHAFGDYQTWIVDGYGTMMREVDKQLGSTKADLVIAPVGVGSFAQAVVSHFKRKGSSTSTLTVEPDTAACLWKSLEKGKFTEIPTTGTIMAGLNCGAPSTIAWDVLKNGVDASLTVSDYEAHQSALYLQSQGINAGPCGGSTLAALRRLTPDDMKALGLNDKSTVVIFCTERNRDYDVPHDVSGNDPVALTQTLVQINSASPDLGSVPGPGETTIARYVAAWLEHRDLETHWVEYTKGRPSVVGVVRGTGGGKSVIFNGHLDTVTIMGYDDDPLSGKIVDGRLYGRGSADMKGGVAAGMIALANAKKLGLRGDVIFTGVADEESLSKGTEDILRAGWRADAAVVSESTNLEVNHAHKGYCHIEIKVYGLAAHGSRADLGIDAIVNAGHFLVEFGKYVKKLQEGHGDETLGTGTAHASIISGGEEASSYPAQCTIIAERRTIPGETNEVVQKEFDDIIAKVAKEITDFKAEAKIFFSRPPQFTAADHPFTKLVSGIVGNATGKDAVIAGAPFWTDCALLAEKGIVPLLWGPKGEGFHGKKEFVHVKSIEQVAEGLSNIAAEFCFVSAIGIMVLTLEQVVRVDERTSAGTEPNFQLPLLPGPDKSSSTSNLPFFKCPIPFSNSLSTTLPVHLTTKSLNMAPPILPYNLVSALQQYKKDTDSVAGWLASKAKHYGYKSQTAEPNDKEAQQKLSGRLKGKARKEAKSKATGTKDGTDKKYIVALKYYVPMAKFIVTHRKPTIQVPMTFFDTIDRVINGRSSFRAQMVEHGIEVDETANQTHLHFVRVMETVRETLRPNMKAADKQKSAEPAEPSKVIEGFNLLTVDEPSREFLDAPNIERPQQMPEDSATYEAEEQDSLDDALVTWHFLMVEAEIIRNQIAWVWKGHRDGKFDLSVAGVITDTGIHMVESLVGQSFKLFDRYGGCLQVGRMYFGMKASQKDYSQKQIDECWKGKHVDSQLSELFNSTFSHVLTILEPLSTMFPNPTETTFDTHDMMCNFKTRCGVPGSDAATLELSVDQLMAARFWNEALVFAENRREGRFKDKFSSYVYEASQIHVISFQLAFATQVHLDVFHIMREDLEQGSSELYKHAKDMRDQMTAFVAGLSRPGSPPGPVNVDESLGQMIRYFDMIVSYCDPQEERARPEKGTRFQCEEGTFEIFELFPAFSGLYLFHARADVANMVVRLIKDVSVMTIMAHLYNAMQQLRMLQAPWVDMEEFQNCFEEHDLFFATKPKKRDDFMMHLLIQLGFQPSAVIYHRKGRNHRQPREFFKAFTPEIPGVAPVSMIFATIVHKRIDPDLSEDDLAYILSASLHKEATAANGADALVPLNLEERKQAKIRFMKPKSKDRQQSMQLSPDQQLRQFALALAAETRELAFPYMGMHNLCLSLLHNISDRCASSLDDLDLSIDPLGSTLNVMLNIIGLASLTTAVVPLREAAEVIEQHVNTSTAIITERIANVGAFGSIPIPNFELYEIPRTMFVEVSAETEPEEDEEITITFEESDSLSE